MDLLLHRPIDSVWRAMKSQIQASTLVLWADKDVALGSGILEGIEAVAPRSEVHMISDCSHWIQNDRREETNRLMRQFLKGPAPAAAAAAPQQPAGAS